MNVGDLIYPSSEPADEKVKRILRQTAAQIDELGFDPDSPRDLVISVIADCLDELRLAIDPEEDTAGHALEACQNLGWSIESAAALIKRMAEIGRCRL